MHALREDREPLRDFSAALTAEPERIAADWGFLWRYADQGRYATQLRRYYDVFDRSQIRVVLYDDLVADPVALCKQLQDFVGVDPSLAPDVRLRHNASGVPRSRALHGLLDPGGVVGGVARLMSPLLGNIRLRRWQVRLSNRNLERRPFPADERAALLERFRSEIEQLEELLDRDLGHWLR